MVGLFLERWHEVSPARRAKMEILAAGWPLLAPPFILAVPSLRALHPVARVDAPAP